MAVTSLVAAAVLGLSACTPPQNSSLVAQYRAGNDKGFIAAGFAVHEYTPADRPAAVHFAGTLADGRHVDSADYAGRVLVVNFWYAACPPCRKEAPRLEQVYRQFARQGVAFLGVDTYDQPATIDSFEKQFGVTYPSIVDVDTKSVTAAFADVLPLSATPTTVVLDRTGRPTARIVGELPSPSILASLIQTAQGVKP